MIKIVIITDPVGEDDPQVMLEQFADTVKVPLRELDLLGHYNGIAEEVLEAMNRADVVLIDYGGMAIGAMDTVVAHVREVCKWAEEHPSKLAILWTQFTSAVYMDELYEQFGKNENIIVHFYDKYSVDPDKVVAWVKTFG